MVLGQIREENYEKVSYMFPTVMEEMIKDTDVFAYAAFAEVNEEAMEPLGCCVIRLQEMQEQLSAAILWLYVVQTKRRQGVGSFMAESIHSMLETADATEIQVPFELVEGIEGMQEFLRKNGFMVDDAAAALTRYISSVPEHKPTIHEALLNLHPGMLYLLPAFMKLEAIMDKSGFSFTEDADINDGPYFLIRGNDGRSMRLYLLPDAEDGEKFMIGVDAELYVPDIAPEVLEQAITSWEAEAEIAQAGFERASDILNVKAFFPYEYDMEPYQADELIAFLHAFFAETEMLKAAVKEVG